MEAINKKDAMAETIDLDKKRAAERRLALLALTGEQPKPSGFALLKTPDVLHQVRMQTLPEYNH